MANRFTNFFTKNKKILGVKNIFYVPLTGRNSMFNGSEAYKANVGGSDEEKHNVSNIFAPIAIQRIKQDNQQWRASIAEAELPILPFRFKMQVAYLDTVLDPHLTACMARRKNLTLLRTWHMCDENGVINEEWSQYFQRDWFMRFMDYSLDALFFGYSLVSLGDIIDGHFEKLTVVRRANISPDRLNVAPVPYSPDGINFTEGEYADWHIWIDTPNQHGLSSCGYGLLYVATNLVIALKNNLIYNTEYVEVYGMPLRQLKTDKKDEENMRQAQASMANMASNNYIITNLDDELVFHDGAKGEGYRSYSELELRLEKKLSKLILGHSDSLDSVPGKLGASQGADSPTVQALYDLQASDANFILPIINEKLIPIMRKHGINIPENLKMEFSNNDEKVEEVNTKNDQLQKMANVALTLANAGYELDMEYFEKATDIKISKRPYGADDINVSIKGSGTSKTEETHKSIDNPTLGDVNINQEIKKETKKTKK